MELQENNIVDKWLPILKQLKCTEEQYSFLSQYAEHYCLLHTNMIRNYPMEDNIYTHNYLPSILKALAETKIHEIDWHLNNDVNPNVFTILRPDFPANAPIPNTEHNFSFDLIVYETVKDTINTLLNANVTSINLGNLCSILPLVSFENSCELLMQYKIKVMCGIRND